MLTDLQVEWISYMSVVTEEDGVRNRGKGKGEETTQLTAWKEIVLTDFINPKWEVAEKENKSMLWSGEAIKAIPNSNRKLHKVVK